MTETSVTNGVAASLGWRRRLGYGVGDFGFNLYWTTASLFLIYYYTDVLGLSPATAGWVFAGALIWDALFDPVMGYLASRTRTRWGRYRPYILWGALPLAASWVLIFVPTGLEGASLVVFAVAAQVLFRTLYAMVGMPFLAMSAVLTRESQERGSLAAIRMVAGTTCGLLSAALTLQLAALFGGGQTGFFWVAVVYGVLATAVLMLVFVSTHEEEIAADEVQPSARDMLRMLRTNRAFWIVSAAMLMTSIGQTFLQKMVPYYLKYALGREDLISLCLVTLVGSVALSMALWSRVAKRWSKRVMWIAGSCVGLLGYLMLWFSPSTPPVVLPILVLVGFGAGAAYLGFWSIIPDTVEFGQWRSGVRAEGAIYGLVSLIQKASLGLAAAGLGELLGAIGYRANVAQTPQTLESMRLMIIVLPALFSVAAAGVIAFYPINTKVHRQLLIAISRGVTRGSRRLASPLV